MQKIKKDQMILSIYDLLENGLSAQRTDDRLIFSHICKHIDFAVL